MPSRTLRIRAAHLGGDVVTGDFVRHIARGPLGIVESISGDCALVINLSQPGFRDIVPLALLMRAVVS